MNIMSKHVIRFLVFSLCIFVLAACTTEASPEDAFSELESIADPNGDIELALDIRISQAINNLEAAELSTQYLVITMTNFDASTPKGKTLKGLILLPPEADSLGNFEIQDLKVRGKINKINNEKVFSGFVIANGGRLGIVPLIAYREGASFEAVSTEMISLEANAELIQREDGLSSIVTRSQEGILLSLTNEELNLTSQRSKLRAQLELTAEIDGFVAQGDAAITLDNGIKFRSAMAGVLACGNATGNQECTRSK